MSPSCARPEVLSYYMMFCVITKRLIFGILDRATLILGISNVKFIFHGVLPFFCKLSIS